jgi:hypothetical protein
MPHDDEPLMPEEPTPPKPPSEKEARGTFAFLNSLFEIDAYLGGGA